jgi:hypothetical protein
MLAVARARETFTSKLNEHLPCPRWIHLRYPLLEARPRYRLYTSDRAQLTETHDTSRFPIVRPTFARRFTRGGERAHRCRATSDLPPPHHPRTISRLGRPILGMAATRSGKSTIRLRPLHFPPLDALMPRIRRSFDASTLRRFDPSIFGASASGFGFSRRIYGFIMRSMRHELLLSWCSLARYCDCGYNCAAPRRKLSFRFHGPADASRLSNSQVKYTRARQCFVIFNFLRVALPYFCCKLLRFIADYTIDCAYPPHFRIGVCICK